MKHPAERLRELEQRARKRFGQNFLVSHDLAANIVSAAGVRKGERVLEIGPGLGVLTNALLAAGADVVAIELDRDLAAVLREDLPMIELIEGDALRVDIPAAARVVANLPYNVGTMLMLRLLPMGMPMALMFQREVAERLVAHPGTKAWGALSVQVQARARTEFLVELGPGAFHPPPKIRSVVVGFRPIAFDFGGVDGDTFDMVVRQGFASRRKTIENSLGQRWSKSVARAALEQASIDPSTRAETLGLAAWRRLAPILGPLPPEHGR